MTAEEMSREAQRRMAEAGLTYRGNQPGSTYEERIDLTPVSNGRWSGERGESTFYSDNPRVREFLPDGGIEYRNGYPDFTPVMLEEVPFNMTSSRTANMVELDKLLAERWGETPAYVRWFRREYGYTWHEHEDMTRGQLIPTVFNSTFRHMGGIGNINRGGQPRP
jgi:hypothetical protein